MSEEFFDNSLCHKDLYSIAPESSGSGNPVLPTIDSVTGEITLTNTTSAGSYTITASLAGSSWTAEFYITTTPPTRATLLTAVAEGIANWGNLGDFNYILTQNITSLYSIFENRTQFNGDITGWTTNNVTPMNSMFFNANAFNPDIGGWTVNNVTDMSNMFSRATAFNQNLVAWENHFTLDAQGKVTGVTTQDMFNNSPLANSPPSWY